MKKQKIRKIISEELWNWESDIIKNLSPNDRIFMTNSENIDLKKIYLNVDSMKMKPTGLWYGFGKSWIDWVRENMPHWKKEHIFKIQIDESKVLKLRSEREVLLFTRGYKQDNYHEWIDWKTVTKAYNGIEIPEYFWNLRLKLLWYYGWDVASGCIWNLKTIKKIERLT